MNGKTFVPATLTVTGRDIPVVVVLAGAINPIDGRYHWYGRVSGAELPRPSRQPASLTIGNEARDVRIEELDPWGNLRISGTGLPPYPMS